MNKEIKVALIGLDTSHTIEFAQRMQGKDTPADQRVEGLRAVSCLRFPTPFQSEEGLDKRQKQLESLGVPVTTQFDEAVKDCDAIMIEINDPALHAEYFAKCGGLGKRIFIDKPLADTMVHAREMAELIQKKQLHVFSTSSLRFAPALESMCRQISNPQFGTVYGPYGKAPAGSSLVWYGVHAAEMLQKIMGRGVRSVWVYPDTAGVVAHFEYENKRRGVMELNEGAWLWGGGARNSEKGQGFQVDASRIYVDLLKKIRDFFQGSEVPVNFEDTMEVMKMLDGARRSLESGKKEIV